MYPKSIKNLIESFKYFPGIGEKTAERLAFSVLNMEDDEIKTISDSLLSIKKNLKRCTICNNLSETEICSICDDKLRDKDTLCVVEDPKTIFLIEKTGLYHGYYHVLSGLISSFDGISPEKLNLHKLIERIENNKFKEVIIAVKPCIEGEMTALYINNILSGMKVSVTRLASGIPMGADMDYVDALTLERAFDNRKNIS
ncbi:MAG: recombination protein RecR [Bacilli bacterium]|nr:recombination protein RecR [Bacilli bacterium]